MPGTPSTRRSFFGLAGGVALLCTIGGEEIDVSAATASNGRRGRRAHQARRRPPPPQAVPQIQPAPGGVRREYWIQAETARWAITPQRKDEWHNRAIDGRNAFTAFVYREMTPGFARLRDRPPDDPRPDARTPRSATCSSCTSATPTRSCARR